MKIIKKPLLTGMRAVAIFEAAKGALVLVAGLGLLTLINRDVQVFAEKMVRLSHLNPASHYPRIFIDAAAHVTNGKLWMLAGAAALYALVRNIEAYGLWYERRWAEWFAMIAGGLYLPVEIYEMIHRLSWVKVVVFGTNLAVVAYMGYALLHSADQDRERGARVGIVGRESGIVEAGQFGWSDGAERTAPATATTNSTMIWVDAALGGIMGCDDHRFVLPPR